MMEKQPKNENIGEFFMIDQRINESVTISERSDKNDDLDEELLLENMPEVVKIM